MEIERSNDGYDLLHLFEEINSASVVEIRVELIASLGELHIDASDITSVVEFLCTTWEDSTCLLISQCSLNHAIVQLAAKYINIDSYGRLIPFLALVTKASSWCSKHLKMSLMSAGEPEEENHSDHFFQLLVHFLTMAASLMSVTSSSVLSEESIIKAAESSIIHLLNLVKDIISDIKMINSIGSEVLKASSSVVDSLVKLWKDYSLAADWDSCNDRFQGDEEEMKPRQLDVVDHFISITKCILRELFQIGVLAAKDGGRLVSILNLSWKGVIAILQQVKGNKLRESLNVQEVILSLISLVKEHLSCASEVWSSSLKDTVTASDARRMFLPVKFYLVHMVKILSSYANEACKVQREITQLIVSICTFRILLCSETLLFTASEVFSDFVDNLSSDLVLCVINSDSVKQETKAEVLNTLFVEDHNTVSRSAYSNTNPMTVMVAILSAGCDDIRGLKILELGRVGAFQSLLRCSNTLEEHVKLKLAQKLNWFLNTIIDEEIYSFILNVKIPQLQKSEWVWLPFFSSLVDSLKAFMVSAYATSAWAEYENFLVDNILHPHFLCCEIVSELWRFFIKHADVSLALELLDKLCSVLKFCASSKLICATNSPLRKLSRTICLLVTNSSSYADFVYIFFVDSENTQSANIAFAALLLEGFSLNSLSENLRSTAKKRVVSDYMEFIDGASFHDVASPVFSLSGALQAQEVVLSDDETKTANFLLTILKRMPKNVEALCDVVSHCLLIFSLTKNLYESDDMDSVLMAIKELFTSECLPRHAIQKCKPYLMAFMGGLGNMEIPETAEDPRSGVVWELYHSALKERQWALAHLAITSFGCFAARTTCNQLWRFVPADAALAYDLSGREPNEENFMSELKGVLEKESALLSIDFCCEQKELLYNEGRLLREMTWKAMFADVEKKAEESGHVGRKRKLPAGFLKGIELLQNGMMVMEEALSEMPSDVQSKASSLEDMISQLVALTS